MQDPVIDFVLSGEAVMLATILRTIATAGTMLAFCCVAAQADVVISNGQTANLSCFGGVCAPTSASAVLNAGDLETMLASGSVKVTTTGSGVQANNIDVRAKLSWSTANTLGLDAYQSIAVAKPVSVAALGGLSLTTNDGGSGGTFSTGRKGRVSFANLSSALTINGATYTLVGSVQTLASAIAANASGDYALADNYNANRDGTYSDTPVTTSFTGTMEGLGNAISNVHVTSNARYVTALFVKIGFEGTVENLGLDAVKITAEPYGRDLSQYAAGMVELNEGILFNDHVSGSIYANAKQGGSDSNAGGLVAFDETAIISNCYSTASVAIADGSPGGLVGGNLGESITGSFATGKVTAVRGKDVTTFAGGLVGFTQDGTISNSYSTGAVAVNKGATAVGGMFGSTASDSVSSSYSTGAVKQHRGLVGGFIGESFGVSCSSCYWDTTTSGTDEGTGEGNAQGITGLTTKQLKSGLPAGFDPTIWARDKKINNGFPYLIANPPPEK
jgi:hypothetical protein